MPTGNHRNNVLGNIRRLASFARYNIPQVRGVSVLGERLDRMSGYGNPSAESTPRNSGFDRFTSPSNGNIANSGTESITAGAGRMARPMDRDSDTIKRWRRT